jgi:hypothetical protein
LQNKFINKLLILKINLFTLITLIIKAFTNGRRFFKEEEARGRKTIIIKKVIRRGK